MVVLHLLDHDISSSLATVQLPESGSSLISQDNVIFTSRRPALVVHPGPEVSLVKRLILLPYHVLFPRSQYYTMTVGLAEQVVFPREAKIPKSVYIEVQAGQQLQTYKASITLTAKLRGVRWILHHYRFPAFITLTLGFWGMEMLFAAVALFLIGLATGSSERSPQADERENPPSLERSQEKEKRLEYHRSEGEVGQVVSKPDTALRPVGLSEAKQKPSVRRRRSKKEKGQSGESVYDDPTRTVRADSDDDVPKEEDDEEKDEKGRFEAKGKEVEQEVKKEGDEDEELGKPLAEDHEDDTRIKVEDDSDI